MTTLNASSPESGDFRFLWLTDLLGRQVRALGSGRRLGRLTDVVFSVREMYPEAVGLYLEQGWGKPTFFVPWDRVQALGPKAIEVRPREAGADFGPFVDQPGWILGEKHLLGQTILDIDGRRVEAVNDVHLVESRGRLAIVHVDASLNGFLRRWRLGRIRIGEERLISWRYVQPLSVEDVSTDRVALSVTREQIQDLPGEDLADALEEIGGLAQQALFAALEPSKAAEALVAAEPRAQRQIVARLPKEKSAEILAQLSPPHIADLLAVLPQDRVKELTRLLPPEVAARVEALIGQRDASAEALASADFVVASRDRLAGAVLSELRRSHRSRCSLSYVYVVDPTPRSLVGVVDLRDLVLAPDDASLSSIMISPAIAARPGEVRQDVEAVLRKYHFRMLPVVDDKDRVLGVIRYADVVYGPEAESRA
jgi:CBS domain-containing protein